MFLFFTWVRASNIGKTQQNNNNNKYDVGDDNDTSMMDEKNDHKNRFVR